MSPEQSWEEVCSFGVTGCGCALLAVPAPLPSFREGDPGLWSVPSRRCRLFLQSITAASPGVCLLGVSHSPLLPSPAGGALAPGTSWLHFLNSVLNFPPRRTRVPPGSSSPGFTRSTDLYIPFSTKTVTFLSRNKSSRHCTLSVCER